MNKCSLLRVKSNLFVLGLIFVFLLSSCGGGNSLFKSQSKKGPNIYSSKGPRTKSRSKLYAHSVSKKKIKKRGSTFSSKKKKYGSTTSGSKGGKNKGDKSSKGGRKSGKGRKKDK